MPSSLSALLAAGRAVSARGWTPATSGNLSVRAAEGFFVTASGTDVGRLTEDDLVHVGPDGVPLGPSRKPSAETALHAAIYARFPDAGAVLHVHSPHATVLSRVVPDPILLLSGYELVKAFTGFRTHEVDAAVPVVDNSQDVPTIARAVAPLLDHANCGPGYLIRGHGLYTWGATVEDALRHADAFDFLFGCEIEHRRIRA